MRDSALEIVIRPVAAGDEAQWRRLWTEYLDFYEISVEEEVYRTAFARLLSDDPHEFHGLLAVVDGRPVGLVHFLFHRHMWKTTDVCYLQDLYAEQQMRGRGVGRALIEAVYRAADAAGAPDVYWLTQEFNATARRLYDRIGQVTPFIRYVRPPRATPRRQTGGEREAADRRG
ncbi:MAG: GNAT family N-acetyltransferase [Alphaproteobacteria bacterium]|nr:MAG: GNAT family N-acetyltransferase [Alphaproteobacteria bacterium]